MGKLCKIENYMKTPRKKNRTSNMKIGKLIYHTRLQAHAGLSNDSNPSAV